MHGHGTPGIDRGGSLYMAMAMQAQFFKDKSANGNTKFLWVRGFLSAAYCQEPLARVCGRTAHVHSQPGTLPADANARHVVRKASWWAVWIPMHNSKLNKLRLRHEIDNVRDFPQPTVARFFNGPHDLLPGAKERNSPSTL